jgi:hypothetical protein
LRIHCLSNPQFSRLPVVAASDMASRLNPQLYLYPSYQFGRFRRARPQNRERKPQI